MVLELLATEENEDDNDFGEVRAADLCEVFAGDFMEKDVENDAEEEFTLRGVITFMVPGVTFTFARAVLNWGFKGSLDSGVFSNDGNRCEKRISFIIQLLLSTEPSGKLHSKGSVEM